MKQSSNNKKIKFALTSKNRLREKGAKWKPLLVKVFNIIFILFIISKLFGISNLSLASPTDSSSIKFSQSPTRWTLSTNNATYQVILSKDSNLVPGYFGPDGGTRVFDAPA